MADRYMLGEGFDILMDSAVTQLNNNIAVVGSSGAGKTMSYVEMCLLQTSESSLIVPLSKRRLVDTYADYLAGKGYRVYDLNLADPGSSTVFFDPMHFVRSQTDITFLARSIVMANPGKKSALAADPFWDDAAISLLSSLIAYTKHTRTNPSFNDVYLTKKYETISR